MSKKTYEFTDETLDFYVNKWTHLALTAGTDINEELLRPGIDFIYGLAGLPAPEEIIICDSVDAVQATAQKILGVNTFVRFATSTLCNVSWVSMYDCFNQETDVLADEESAELKKTFETYCDFLNSGVFSAIYLRNTAIVGRRPSVIRRDDDFRLHHDTLPALEFADGVKICSLDGVIFDEELFKKVSSKTVTLEEINAITNADQRTIAYKYGLPPDSMLKDLGAVLVSVGERGSELYRIDNFRNLGRTQWCLTMVCPTGRSFLEFVPPEVAERAMREYKTEEKDNAADFCQANAYSISLDEYLSIIHHG